MRTRDLIVDPDNPNKRVIEEAAKAIATGGLVAFPTDTVYGLGTNIYDELAIRRLYRIKDRPASKGLIALIADLAQLDALVATITPEAERLMRTFWPGPLTIILPAGARVPVAATVKGNLGIRLPDSRVTLGIINQAGVPLASTSANKSGGPSPVTADDVRDSALDIDVLVDGGGCAGVESTVLDLTMTPARIVRHGALSIDEIGRVLKVG